LNISLLILVHLQMLLSSYARKFVTSEEAALIYMTTG
jgi:hypothetical protein